MSTTAKRILLDFSNLNLPSGVERVIRFLTTWFTMASVIWRASKYQYVFTVMANAPDHETMLKCHKAATEATDKVINSWEKARK